MAMNRHAIVTLIGIALLGLSGVRTTATAGLQSGLTIFSESCPSAADFASINRDLRLSFESDPTRGTQVCSAAAGSGNLTLMQSRAYAALIAMRQLSFDKPLPWTKDPLYRWFIKTVNGIRFRSDIEYSSCCDSSGMINVRAVVEGPSISISIRDSRQSPELMFEGFLGLLVHEARHNNGFPHTCGNKDTSLKELGAWSAQYHFHMWMADHTSPDLFTAAHREEFRRMATNLCSGQFCEDRCRDRIEEMEYAVMSAAVTAVLEPPGPNRTIIVSDRTVGFSCETGADTGWTVGDCNGMRSAKQSPDQALAAIRKAMPVVSKEMTESLLIGASGSFPIERQLMIPARQILWGPSSGRPLPQGLVPELAIYPSRAGFNPDRDRALIYLGVRALSGQSKSFGEYIFLTKTNNRWEVKGRARVWESAG
jgi:hypothetical protein